MIILLLGHNLRKLRSPTPESSIFPSIMSTYGLNSMSDTNMQCPELSTCHFPSKYLVTATLQWLKETVVTQVQLVPALPTSSILCSSSHMLQELTDLVSSPVCIIDTRNSHHGTPAARVILGSIVSGLSIVLAAS